MDFFVLWMAILRLRYYSFPAHFQKVLRRLLWESLCFIFSLVSYFTVYSKRGSIEWLVSAILWAEMTLIWPEVSLIWPEIAVGLKGPYIDAYARIYTGTHIYMALWHSWIIHNQASLASLFQQNLYLSTWFKLTWDLDIMNVVLLELK